MKAVTVFSPAKLNLFLAITGRRPDGFHELVSVVAPLKFGDSLHVELAADGMAALECNVPEVPRDDTNLVLKAYKLFRESTGWSGGVRFVLTKRIPVGAGMGGGSSNATAALRALDLLAKTQLTEEHLGGLAAKLGSDCPLFLADGPVVMRGRGERVEVLSSGVSARVRGRRVLVFKPSFGIATAWAYGAMAAEAAKSGADAVYMDAAEAERRVLDWKEGRANLDELLCNNMETMAFRKYLALPAIINNLREEFGLVVRMSGSGSACFTLLPGDAPLAKIEGTIRNALGRHIFLQTAELM